MHPAFNTDQNQPGEQEKRYDFSPADLASSMRELEAIVDAIEDGSLGLEDALARYEKAQHLIRHCRTVLQDAESRVSCLHPRAA